MIARIAEMIKLEFSRSALNMTIGILATGADLPLPDLNFQMTRQVTLKLS